MVKGHLRLGTVSLRSYCNRNYMLALQQPFAWSTGLRRTDNLVSADIFFINNRLGFDGRAQNAPLQRTEDKESMWSP
jgi:hypothetical protein